MHTHTLSHTHTIRVCKRQGGVRIKRVQHNIYLSLPRLTTCWLSAHALPLTMTLSVTSPNQVYNVTAQYFVVRNFCIGLVAKEKILPL